MGDQPFADLLVAQAFLLELRRHQRADLADSAARRMIILVATVKALVADGVAVTEARQLRQRHRDFFGHLIRRARLAGKLFWRQCRRQRLRIGRRLEMRWNSAR